jgi:hypothetical protein
MNKLRLQYLSGYKSNVVSCTSLWFLCFQYELLLNVKFVSNFQFYETRFDVLQITARKEKGTKFSIDLQNIFAFPQKWQRH